MRAVWQKPEKEVDAAKAHVIEWHAATLGIMAPPMPKAAYVLAKLKKTLAVERPLGKAVRTGFTNIEIKDIFGLGSLHDTKQHAV